MRIYQRTGANTGISYSAGSLVLGVLILGTMVTKAWPVAVVLVLVLVAFNMGDKRNHEGHLAEGRPRPNCRFCERELAELRDRERQETERADWERLQGKYGRSA